MTLMKKTVTASLIAGLAAGIASAQVNTYSEGAAAGYNPSAYIAPIITLSRPDSDFGTDKRITGGGLRFGKPVSKYWDMQLGLNLARANDGANRYEQATLGIDALYMFSRSAFRPLLLVGVGAERDKFTSPTVNASSTSPYIGAGGGFQVSFNDQWGMQADIRRNHAYLRGNDFAAKRANTDVISVALTYAFEKMPAPTPRAAPAPAYVAPAPVAVAQAPAPMPAPAPPVVMAPTARFERITMSANKLFNFDSAELRTPMPKLDEVSDALIKSPEINNIVISGYTDRLGSDAYNQTLSQKRADAVKNYMANRGVSASRMTATGKGETKPVVFCSDKKMAALIECLEPNRRVEVEEITIDRRVQ